MLDEGALCKVLEKGEEQVIRGNQDFWYKIEHVYYILNQK